MTRLLQLSSLSLVVFCIMIACGGPSKDAANAHKGKDATTGGEAVAHGADDGKDAHAEEETVVLGCASASECGDEIACTRDECVAGDCEHIADNTLCKTGEVCILAHGGCIAAKPCFENEDCKKENEENCYLGDGEYGKCNTCVIRGCEKEPEKDKGFCTAEYYDGDCSAGEVCLGDLYESLPSDMTDGYNDFSEATGCYEGTRCAKNSECDDKVACTKDACLPQSVCRHVPEDALCDDGNQCTTDGCDPQNSADASGCVHYTDFAVCNDGISCTNDECGSDGACSHTPNDMGCADGIDCTADACGETGCTSTPNHALCDDGAACTKDLCDPAQGWGDDRCVHSPDDAACDDGVACTIDICADSGGCTHEPNHDICDDDLPCTDDVCNSASGCVNTSNCIQGYACDSEKKACVVIPVDTDKDGFSSFETGGTDCNDNDPQSFPGAPDTVGDKKDQNCDGVDGVDADMDGYPSQQSGGKDCDDETDTINPAVDDYVQGTCIAFGQPWIITEIADDVSCAAMTLDDNGGKHIVYTSFIFNYALTYITGGSDAWKESIVSPGEFYNYPAIALDSQNSVHLVYNDYASDQLYYTTNTTGSWIVTTLAEGKLSYVALALDQKNNAHVTYVNGGLGLYHVVFASGLVIGATVDTDGGPGNSLHIDPAGLMHVVYGDQKNNYDWSVALKYATKYFSAPIDGPWSKSTIDPWTDVFPSLASSVDASGNIHVAYLSLENQYALKYATNNTGVMEITTIEDMDGKDFADVAVTVDIAQNAYVASLAGVDAQSYVLTVLRPSNMNDAWTIETVESGIESSWVWRSLNIVINKLGGIHLIYTDAFTLKYATQTCIQIADEFDKNCDGVDGIDADGDKIASIASGGTDCDDNDPSVYPGAKDVVGDTKDKNCDGKDG